MKKKKSTLTFTKKPKPTLTLKKIPTSNRRMMTKRIAYGGWGTNYSS